MRGVSVLISGSGPGQWGDHLRTALPLDFPELVEAGHDRVVLVSASLDGWAVEVRLPDPSDSAVADFLARLERYLDSDYDPWDVNIVVTPTRPASG